MSGTSINPYEQALFVLDNPAPLPPSGFKYRLIIQLVLCATLFITCSSYLGLSIHNRVQTGKRIRLIGLQTLSEGSIIVLDALMLFSIAACMACILIIVDLVYKYRIYVLDADAPWQLQINSLLLIFVAFLQGWAYTFSNAAATIQIFKKGRGLAAAGRVWVTLHNGFLLGLISVYFCVAVPAVSLLMDLAHQSADLRLELYSALRRASAEFTASPTHTPSLQTLVEAQNVQTKLVDLRDKSRTYQKVWLSINVFSVSIFVIAGVASLAFVVVLRKQTQWYRNNTVQGSILVSVRKQTTMDDGRGEVSKAASQDADVTEEGGPTNDPYPTAAPKHLNPYPSKTTKKVGFGANSPSSGVVQASTKSGARPAMSQESRGAVAVTRLADDLTLSVPCVLFMCLFFLGVGTFGFVHTASSSDTWAVKEFGLTAFPWVYLIIMNVIFAFFLVNLIRNPGRYGSTSSPLSSASPSMLGSRFTNISHAHSRGHGRSDSGIVTPAFVYGRGGSTAPGTGLDGTNKNASNVNFSNGLHVEILDFGGGNGASSLSDDSVDKDSFAMATFDGK